MQISWKEYCDKVRAAWIGKNIGGTLGGPYEGKREYLDVKGFQSKAGAPLPNDDLDLQLIWLHAIERLGPRNVNAQTLGEMWISFMPAHWHEYGICKSNLRMGLPAPVSGDYKNNWKNSNGAWIRTEVWACLAPAAPEVAAKYAIYDASVDHGTGEGTAAAAFVAAMESAAFLEKDLRKLINIGLAAIPENGRMADSIRHILECYDSGMTSREARDSILERNSDIGTGWFEAPSNVAYVIIGLLYGEGDFKKSMLEAVNCGDDTDCTAATVGALLGIMGGTAALPEDWCAHIGDDIVTVAVNKALYGGFPKTCTELAQRVIKQMPLMYQANSYSMYEDEDGKRYIGVPDGSSDEGGFWQQRVKRIAGEISARKPYTAEYEVGPVKLLMTTVGAPDIKAGGSIDVELTLENNCAVYGNIAYGVRLTWRLPEGFSAESEQGSRIFLPHGVGAKAEYRAKITAGDVVNHVNRLALIVEIEGRPTVGCVPLTLIG